MTEVKKDIQSGGKEIGSCFDEMSMEMKITGESEDRRRVKDQLGFDIEIPELTYSNA